MTSLFEVAKYFRTDKERHGYLPIYQDLLTPFLGQAVSICEIGVLHGGSIQMWAKWAPRWKVVGVERKVQWRPDPSLERIHLIEGNVNDQETIRKIVDHGPYVAIIDDASHLSRDHLNAFSALWPHVSPGGWYILEDLHTLWMARYTPLGSPTILDMLCDRFQAILTGQDEIKEVRLIGNSQADGFMALRKASCSKSRPILALARKDGQHVHELPAGLRLQPLELTDLQQVSTLAELEDIEDNAYLTFVPQSLPPQRPPRDYATLSVVSPSWARFTPSLPTLQITKLMNAIVLSAPPHQSPEHLSPEEHTLLQHNEPLVLVGNKYLSTPCTSMECAGNPRLVVCDAGKLLLRHACKTVKLNGPNFLVGFTPTHFGHMIMESYRRLWACQHLDAFHARFRFICTPSVNVANRMLLQTLGITPERTLASPKLAVFCHTLYVPSPCFCHRHAVVSCEMKNIWNSIGEKFGTGSSAKVFLSRSRDPSDRRPLKADLARRIDRLLESFDYHIAYPIQMVLDKQIELVRGARRLVGIAGSSNLLGAFSTQPQKRLIIAPHTHRAPADFHLAHLQGATLDFFVARDVVHTPERYEWAVDLDQLERALKGWEDDTAQ